MREKIKKRDDRPWDHPGPESPRETNHFHERLFRPSPYRHIRYLEEAKSLGDILVVGVNSDTSVRGLKGPNRPILPEEDRAEVLSGLGCVDYVTIFDEPTPSNLISLLLPHLLVKGGDWTKEATVGWETVEGAGGEVVILPLGGGASTHPPIHPLQILYAFP